MSEIRGVPLGICLLVGLVLWFVPAPEGLDARAWHLCAVFAATILSLILRPLPMGASVLVALVVLAVTRTLADKPKDAFHRVLDGFAEPVVWLVVAAMLIAGSVIRTGLGKRIALVMVRYFGRTTLGLGYAIAATEFVLGPFIPSNTARGGGVMAPLVDSLSRALGSKPDSHPERAGRFLVLCGAHLNLVTAAMFLTGMAANSLVSDAARKTFGDSVHLDWSRWLIGSIVPGLVSLLLLPLLLYYLVRPTVTDASCARADAARHLADMGPWSREQITLAILFAAMVALWVSTPLHGMYPGLVALLGVIVLILSGVEKWKDLAANFAAWDALVWLGGLVMMANALLEMGVMDWFGEQITQRMFGLNPIVTVLALAVIYFYSMYGFSMLTGHITALAGIFFAIALASGTPPMLMVVLIAYFSNLCGCLTNYSTGPVVIYFGLGYVPAKEWYRVGFLVSLLHMAVWLGIGLPYWKLLGWW